MKNKYKIKITYFNVCKKIRVTMILFLSMVAETKCEMSANVLIHIIALSLFFRVMMSAKHPHLIMKSFVRTPCLLFNASDFPFSQLNSQQFFFIVKKCLFDNVIVTARRFEDKRKKTFCNIMTVKSFKPNVNKTSRGC